MSGHLSWKHLVSFALTVGIPWGTVVPADAHTQPDQTKQVTKQKAAESIYEGNSVKVKIPGGWRVQDRGQRPVGAVVLEKNGFELKLAFHARQASGIVGGRFIEVFAMNWFGLEDAWTCSGYLQQVTWPASRNLIFVNLIIPTGDAKVRDNCAIPKALGGWTVRNGQKEYEGDDRWFGGYFTTENGGYFFDGDDEGCGLKAYTLTSQATAPDRLPIADIPNQNNNPQLEKIIQEAIDIVNSIDYKRCKPF